MHGIIIACYSLMMAILICYCTMGFCTRKNWIC